MKARPKNPPPHPGVFLRASMDRFGTGTREMARALNFSVSQLSKFLRGQVPCSLQLAQKLDDAGLGSRRTWLLRQVDYDLYVWAQLTRVPQ